MDVELIAQRLRAALEDSPHAHISDVIALVSSSVRSLLSDDVTHAPSASTTPRPSTFVVQLERVLLDIYETVVDHHSVKHLESFLAILFALRPLLPASSIITWFDHLRTALREPRLGTETTRGLRDLIAHALKDTAYSSESRSGEFRKRILQLYLFDALGGGSVEETVEQLNRPRNERESRIAWTENLEQVLLADAMNMPNVSVSDISP